MINTRFWSDGFVVEKLNALDRLLFLYLLTNEKANIVGIYELPIRTAAFETGIDKDDLEKMLNRLAPKIEYFNGWVYIRRFVDHQQSNPSINRGMIRELETLPSDVINRVKELGTDSLRLKQAIDSLSQSVTESGTVSVIKPKPQPKPKPQLKVNKESKLSLRVKSEDIDHVFGEWEKVTGYGITSNVKSNREAASKLLKEHSMTDVEGMIRGVALSHADQYAPRVANFVQLYRKWDDLMMWGRRTQTASMTKRQKSFKI